MPDRPAPEAEVAARLVAAPPLPATFYLRGAKAVARDLLGKVLVVRGASGVLAGEIVETEAYLAGRDPASHAYRGETTRNRSMFALGGICYVYLSYGINVCMNVVTGPAGRAEAVLLRALAPLCGVGAMIGNRRLAEPLLPAARRRLTNGPGKLTQALGIGLDYDGRRLDRPDFKLVDFGTTIGRGGIGASGRIGITKAVDLPLRFFVLGSPWLSR